MFIFQNLMENTCIGVCFFNRKTRWSRYGAFIINFEYISHFVLVFLLLTLNRDLRLIGFCQYYNVSNCGDGLQTELKTKQDKDLSTKLLNYMDYLPLLGLGASLFYVEIFPFGNTTHFTYYLSFSIFFFLALTLSCRYHIETSPMICRGNQWTGFYMIMTSVMKGLKVIC